ncbi:hypothetical protein [Ulvibacter antarcticus]|uniref:Uncharacterized protein n=1 Tax=Ulvibacter antarcticus TaxID=442714 RepID=A0A3L9Z491_9FLAO|nr:hypothetical protein [Ulvibacter antarcticus]RMA67711.1 hypothetical protein BXY75_0021 [Ulvibacter antarcticus]
MNKTILTFLAVGLINLSCSAQVKKSNLEIEAEKWTKELISEDGINYCEENSPSLSEFLKQMSSSESDINSDGIKDGLFYYRYNSCGGTANFSDLSMLTYSENGKLVTDKNFTQTIIKKIKSNLSKKQLSEFGAATVNFKGLGNSVIGTYSVWVGEDPNGFPSINGMFQYSPDSEYPYFETSLFAE